MYRQILRVNRQALLMDRRMDRRILRTDKPVLRVGKRVPRVINKYCEWPVELCMYYEWQDDNNDLSNKSHITWECKISFFFENGFPEMLICDDYIYLHLSRLVKVFDKKTKLCGKNLCETPHRLLLHGKFQLQRIRNIYFRKVPIGA